MSENKKSSSTSKNAEMRWSKPITNHFGKLVSNEVELKDLETLLKPIFNNSRVKIERWHDNAVVISPVDGDVNACSNITPSKESEDPDPIKPLKVNVKKKD